MEYLIFGTLVGLYAWSLFIPFVKTREWGFIKNNKWIPHDKYLNIKE